VSDAISKEETERAGLAMPFLEQARAFGFLGPGPCEVHLRHALGFLAAMRQFSHGSMEHERIVDLGAGGGLPGLVLAVAVPTTSWLFLDSNRKRMAVLQEAVVELGLASRVEVLCSRAEEAGRLLQHRASYDAVMARGFAGPSPTAECAAPLLRAGGLMVISEPPEEQDRWDVDGLAKLGLEALGKVKIDSTFFVARQKDLASATYPRRVGLPEKRPVF
jgi:16S rRNA (guanine527-N7)-methyltransferase